jgi:SAM-dependent methyltransferase
MIEIEPGVLEGTCWVCGAFGVFRRGTEHLLGGFECPNCRARLRYQGQASALVRCYSTGGARSLAALVQEPAFSALRVYEPGTIGPLARHLRRCATHVRSSFTPGAERGAEIDGVRQEDLMALTFPDESFDLVVTSDIMEHVRHPRVAFEEIRRVLTVGGRHVFTIPPRYPMEARTVSRVDVSGPEDVFLVKPAYHNGHLVYNDFGADLLELLDDIGFETEVLRFESPNADAATQITFCSRKR